MVPKNRAELEIWRDIPGFEGLYQVSNHGRVKRLKHWKNQRCLRNDKHCVYRELPEKIMCLRRTGGGGSYWGLSLAKDRKIHNRLVHRLVAQAFIPNPDNLPEINHKDCNGLNNHVENLEWCDRKYNINYADRTIKAAKACEKKVICIETGKIYDSLTSAAAENGLLKSRISNVCHGKRKTTGGFHWSFA